MSEGEAEGEAKRERGYHFNARNAVCESVAKIRIQIVLRFTTRGWSFLVFLSFFLSLSNFRSLFRTNGCKRQCNPLSCLFFRLCKREHLTLTKQMTLHRCDKERRKITVQHTRDQNTRKWCKKKNRRDEKKISKH